MDDQVLREQVLALLKGGNAHMKIDEAVIDFPPDQINTRPTGVPYTFWHLLEHIRIAQWDILEFVVNPNYVSPEWPSGYWPPANELADPEGWKNTIRRIHEDLRAVEALVADPANDLTAPLPHAPGYNLLREALLVADHNAYHLGEFGILRQVMGFWPENTE